MSTTLQKNDRVVWIDLLRVFASCMVPIAHLCSNCWNLTEGVNSSDFFVLNVFNSASRWVVPVFVMISGIFFLNPEKKCDPKKIFSKNIVRMATAFIFWSFLYALQWTLFRPHAQGEAVVPFSKTFFLSELVKGEYHMWYLYMIALLYLFTPLIRVFSDNATKKQLEFFILASLVFACFFPMLNEFPFLQKIGIKSLNEHFHLSFVSGYIGMYVAGQYLVRFPLEKLKRNIMYALGILSYFFTLFANLWISRVNNKPSKAFLEAQYINATLVGIALFIFFKYEVSKINFSDRAVKIISWLSARSFGVYLCHVFVMRAFQYFGIQVIHFSPAHATVDMSAFSYVHIPPIIGVPVLATLVVIISFGVSALISKIPVLKKYVV